jgi:CRP-like cAMP-binding protein
MFATHIPMQPAGLMGFWDRVTSADWADVLAAFPLFSGIPNRRLRRLVRRATFAQYGPGDVVVQKGAPADSVYVILSGSAKARAKPAARTLRTGDYFGELGLLDGVPRSATVVATDELHVMRLPGASFLRLAQHNPSISLKMASNVGWQVRRLETRTAEL